MFVVEVRLRYFRISELPMEDPEVPTEHLHEEIHEQAAHSREPWTLGVALSSTLLASFAAVASLMAGHYANEAMIHQIEASDQWSYYQSKGIKETELTSKAGILDALGKQAPEADKAKIAGYQQEREKIERTAERLEKEGRHHMHTHQKLASSVTMFQIAISLGAISVLIRRRKFWYASVAVGLVGVTFLIQAIVTAGVH
jgi:heme/copper-type cytochrome/quinol oxidase subunit 4